MITEKQFLRVYKPANKLTLTMQWFYKGSGRIICLSTYLLSFILMFFECKGYWETWTTLGKLSFIAFLTIFPIAILTAIGVIINNARIKRISKLLDIDPAKFKTYEDMYIKNI